MTMHNVTPADGGAPTPMDGALYRQLCDAIDRFVDFLSACNRYSPGARFAAAVELRHHGGEALYSFSVRVVADRNGRLQYERGRH